jgi:hypothetical protein
MRIAETRKSSGLVEANEILGTVLLILQLPLTHANHAFLAMPDGRDGSSIAFL